MSSHTIKGTWRDIFRPQGWNFHHNFPPERCARALRAKLTTGRADWGTPA